MLPWNLLKHFNVPLFCLCVCLSMCLIVAKNFNLGDTLRTIRDRDFICGLYTVKHLLFAMTLFSRTFARRKRRENKVLVNNLSYKDYRTKEDNSRK